MPTPITIDIDWDTLITASASDVFFPACDPIPAAGVNGIRGWLELRARTNLLLKFGFHLTNDLRAQGTIVGVAIAGGTGGYADADGFFDPSATITTVSADGSRWIQPGWIGKASSGTAFGRARGTVQLLR